MKIIIIITNKNVVLIYIFSCVNIYISVNIYIFMCADVVSKFKREFDT